MDISFRAEFETKNSSISEEIFSPLICRSLSFIRLKTNDEEIIEAVIDLFKERQEMFEDSFLFRLGSTVGSLRLETLPTLLDTSGPNFDDLPDMFFVDGQKSSGMRKNKAEKRSVQRLRRLDEVFSRFHQCVVIGWQELTR